MSQKYITNDTVTTGISELDVKLNFSNFVRPVIPGNTFNILVVDDKSDDACAMHNIIVNNIFRNMDKQFWVKSCDNTIKMLFEDYVDFNDWAQAPNICVGMSIEYADTVVECDISHINEEVAIHKALRCSIPSNIVIKSFPKSLSHNITKKEKELAANIIHINERFDGISITVEKALIGDITHNTITLNNDEVKSFLKRYVDFI